MRAVVGILTGLLGVSALSGCSSNDKVLTPDDEQDSGASNGGADASSGQNNGGSSATADGGASGGNGNGASTGSSTGSTTHVAKDADCDMNGIWFGRQVTESSALGMSQFSNNWYYLELAQDGEDVVVTKHFDCGVQVEGSVSVTLSITSLATTMKHNIQAGRKGKLSKDADGTCHFSMERFWSIRGADEARFAPNPRNSTDTIANIKMANPLPTKDKPDGAEDWDDDGILGIAWQINNGAGVRNTVQRDWTEWFSDAEFPIMPSTTWSDPLQVRARFDNEENLIQASSPLFGQGAQPVSAAKHRLDLKFVGRDLAGSRVQGLDPNDQAATCKQVRDALPLRNKF